jgi:hypothetical protein
MKLVSTLPAMNSGCVAQRFNDRSVTTQKRVSYNHQSPYLQELNVVVHTGHFVLFERRGESAQCSRSVDIVHDQLGNHGVVVDRHHVTAAHTRVHAHLL